MVSSLSLLKSLIPRLNSCLQRASSRVSKALSSLSALLCYPSVSIYPKKGLKDGMLTIKTVPGERLIKSKCPACRSPCKTCSNTYYQTFTRYGPERPLESLEKIRFVRREETGGLLEVEDQNGESIFRSITPLSIAFWSTDQSQDLHKGSKKGRLTLSSNQVSSIRRKEDCSFRNGHWWKPTIRR